MVHGTESPRLLTIGEAMMLIGSPPHRRLAVGAAAEVGIAGAEATVAVAARRLGIVTEWIGGLGEDLPGDMILAGLRAHDVQVARVLRRGDAPTGVLFRDVGVAHPRLHYARRGSAASVLTEDDISEAALREADHVHMTGITPALSNTCAQMVERVAHRVREHGKSLSLDVNYRATLWSAERARSVLETLAATVDILFCGVDELSMMWGNAHSGDIDAQLDLLRALGPGEVVLKRGSEGASAWTKSTGRVDAAARPTAVVDPVGAGDAFVAGYLVSRLSGGSAIDCLELGNVVAASAISAAGDLAGLPEAAILSKAQQLGTDVVR